MATPSDRPAVSPDRRLRQLIERFAPDEQKRIRALRTAMKKRLPGANELVYDYGTFFVVSYSPTEQPLDAVAAVAARPDGMRLYLMGGPSLSDPEKLLEGSGRDTRFVRLDSARQLAQPAVAALLAAAIAATRVPLPAEGAGKLVIKTFGGERVARRKAKK